MGAVKAQVLLAISHWNVPITQHAKPEMWGRGAGLPLHVPRSSAHLRHEARGEWLPGVDVRRDDISIHGYL